MIDCGSADPWAIVLEHEAQATPAERRRRGAWYTPRHLVDELVALVCRDLRDLPSFIVDPSCGGGGFLLGALDHLVNEGLPPEEALGRVGGLDIEPSAMVAVRAAITAWCTGHGLETARAALVRLGVGDALEGLPTEWPVPDVIVGNPPFASPLRTGDFPPGAQRVRKARADVLGPYADLAALHLLAAVESCAPGGRVCMILPQSILAGRDTAALRAMLERIAPARAVWTSRADHFAASVNVWAPVLMVGGDPEPVMVHGPTGASLVAPAPWAQLAAQALGVPSVSLGSKGRRSIEATLGSITSATAGFRDEYYGIAAVCVEEGDGASVDGRSPMRVITSGSLDPLRCRWGTRPTTFAKQRWLRPVADRGDFTESLARWVDEQARPKVVLPTQSRVFEPVIDAEGLFLPVTPVLSIHSEPELLGRVAAVLLAPPVVAWAHSRWFGTAMSIDAMKLAARDLAEIPLPQGSDAAWEEAGRLAAGVDAFDHDPAALGRVLASIGALMSEAYDSSDDVLEWWIDRLPT